MHAHAPILAELVIIAGAALLVTLISNRLKIPSLVGFLLTGVLIGPYGLALVPEKSDVETFAELGVIFLLFIIGLELSTEELRRMGRLFVVGGGLQAGLTTALTTAACRFLFNMSWELALFFGFVVTLSSTAVVLKLYDERRESESPHGRSALGILLFQDVLIVPMLIVVPVLAGGEGTGLADVALTFLEGGAVIVGVLLVGRFVMPRILDVLVRTRVRELLVLGALLASLGTGLLTEKLGLSMALGAFLAGVALAESDVRHQVQSEIASFRDLFISLFFTSIGMLLSVPYALQNFAGVVAVAAAILLVKTSIIFVVVRIVGLPIRTALATGLGLSQIGEFSFVLVRAGKAEGLLSQDLGALLIASSVLTLLVTPALIALAPRIADLFSGRHKEPEEASVEEQTGHDEEEMSNHVVIIGYGRNGRDLARVLAEAGISYLIVEANALTVRKLKEQGLPVLFGDITRYDIQRAAGIERARIAVLVFPDPTAIRRTLKVMRELHPTLHLIVRTRQVEHIDELLGYGASEVVTQDLETSIELTARILERLRLPDHIVRSSVRALRSDQYQALRTATPRTGLSETLLKVLAAGTVEAYSIYPEHPARGRSILELKLRAETGSTILAVLRGSEILANPDPDLELESGDALVLVGSHAELEEAIRFLDHLKTETTED